MPREQIDLFSLPNRVRRVLQLHRAGAVIWDEKQVGQVCTECERRWPCATVVILLAKEQKK